MLRLIVVALIAAATVSHAQVTTATILGTVTDNSGAVMPNVPVTATNVATHYSRTDTTDAEGRYSIRLLPTGTYQVEAAAPGFKKFVQTGIVLEVDRTARVQVILDLGALSESVSVTADAPLVNTANASVGRTVGNTEIANLPLVNRDVYSLLNLTPGVESSTGANTFGFREQITMINGAPYASAGTVNYFLDGGNSTTGLRNTGNTIPNPDALQEFRVITNSYGAEFGRFAGGVIDVVTKSGTNSVHGSLFEFLRNDLLNANTWGALRRPPLRRNQFGGTLGGPLRKDRTFLFATYSGLRQRQVAFLNTAIVPTSRERQGDFSQSAKKPNDPLTRQPFPNGLIPLGRFDPTALNILDRSIPSANLPNNYYQVTPSTPDGTDEFQTKIDHALTSKHQLAASYYLTRGFALGAPEGNLVWSQRRFQWQQQNFNASDTWTINPATINQLRATYVRNFGGRRSLPEMSLGDLGSRFQIQGPPALPDIQVSGYFRLGQGIAGPTAGSNYYGLRDTLSITHSGHSIKFGGEFALEKCIHGTTLNNYGQFSFDGTITGNALADFLTGLPVTMNQDAPIIKLDNFWYTGLFIQDDWRIHPRLTLNLGFRYDLQTPPTDTHDRKLTYVAGAQSKVVPAALPGLLFPGDPGVGRGIVAADKNNFAPRAGLAWDPTGSGKSSVRAAFGVFYGSVTGNEWNGTADNQPFSTTQRFNQVKSLTDPYGLVPGGSPYPYSYSPGNPRWIFPAMVWGPSLDFKWPYTYQMNFSLQRQLAANLSMEAAYVGSISHKLPFTADVNYPVYGPGATTGNVDSRRPVLPGKLAAIMVLNSTMNSAYHGLQITVDRRMSRNFQFKGYYTFSKSLEGANMQNTTTGGGAEDFRNLRLERARTNNDRRHNVVATAVWRIDYFRGAPLLRWVLNDWMISGIATLRSGNPLTVTAGTDRNLDGNSNDRANPVGDPWLDPNRPRAEVTKAWFNTSAFAIPALGTNGLAGRNILDGPGSKNIDLGLFRDLRIRERMRLQFRAEMTNALNLVNLSSPTTGLNSSAVGTIRNAGPMRQVQFGLRLAF